MEVVDIEVADMKAVDKEAADKEVAGMEVVADMQVVGMEFGPEDFHSLEPISLAAIFATRFAAVAAAGIRVLISYRNLLR